MSKMKLCWSLILCIVQITVTFGFDERTMKDILSHKPPGFLDILTKPKIPKIPAVGIQIGIGGGSFGIGFGIGSRPSSGDNHPPKDKPHPEKEPETTGEEDKENIGPRPNWGDETADDHHKDEHHNAKDHHKDKDEQSKPDHDEDKDEKSKPAPYEEDKDYARPDWESIGEPDRDRSDDYEYSDGTGLINPRLGGRRSKRLVDSKVYHVPLKFFSNARPYKVQFHGHPNSLTNGNYIK